MPQADEVRETMQQRAMHGSALGIIDVLASHHAALPPKTPATIMLFAGRVPIGRAEFNDSLPTAALVSRGLPLSAAQVALGSGLAALLAGGVRELPVTISDARYALDRDLPVPDKLPTVTVAICTRDRERQLDSAIKSAIRSINPVDEVLVVDNASRSDATLRVVRQYPGVRYAREDRPGLGWARNRAIVESRGDIISFCDDDCVLDHGCLQALRSAAARNPEVDAITGLVEPLALSSEAQTLADRYLMNHARYRRVWVQAPRSATIAREVGNVGRYGIGASLAIRRRSLERIGIFDTALGAGTLCRAGEDMEFFFRLLKSGGMLLYEPRVSVRHDLRSDLTDLKTQFEFWSRGFACAVERSILAYPEERFPYRILLARIALLRHARRALLRRDLRPVAMAELRGLLGAKQRYLTSRRATEDTALRFHSPAGDAPPTTKPVGQPGVRHAVSTSIDVSHPVQPLEFDNRATDATIDIRFRGRTLGTITLGVTGAFVGADRLCDAIAEHLGPQLLGTRWTPAVVQMRETLRAILSRSVE